MGIEPRGAGRSFVDKSSPDRSSTDKSLQIVWKKRQKLTYQVLVCVTLKTQNPSSYMTMDLMHTVEWQSLCLANGAPVQIWVVYGRNCSCSSSYLHPAFYYPCWALYHGCVRSFSLTDFRKFRMQLHDLSVWQKKLTLTNPFFSCYPGCHLGHEYSTTFPCFASM